MKVLHCLIPVILLLAACKKREHISTETNPAASDARITEIEIFNHQPGNEWITLNRYKYDSEGLLTKTEETYMDTLRSIRFKNTSNLTYTNKILSNNDLGTFNRAIIRQPDNKVSEISIQGISQAIFFKYKEDRLDSVISGNKIKVYSNYINGRAQRTADYFFMNFNGTEEKVGHIYNRTYDNEGRLLEEQVDVQIFRRELGQDNTVQYVPDSVYSHRTDRKKYFDNSSVREYRIWRNEYIRRHISPLINVAEELSLPPDLDAILGVQEEQPMPEVSEFNQLGMPGKVVIKNNFGLTEKTYRIKYFSK